MTWMASITGKPVELLNPYIHEVDFAAMASALSHLNRFCGQAQMPVSVGLHKLIGCDLAPEPLRPWWLLHDAPEERTGDMTTPVKETYYALATEMFGEQVAVKLEQVRKEFERRHEVVIHEAAGLPLPTEEQKREIKRIDLITLATEKRCFHTEQKRPWFIDLQGIEPAKRIYRWKPPAVIAEELHRRFCQYLPALSNRRVA
jgi:uncharacterized protein